MAELEGKVAVILGASSIGGLGEFIARLFVKEGAKVMLSGRKVCLLYTSPSPRDQRGSRMPSSA